MLDDEVRRTTFDAKGIKAQLRRQIGALVNPHRDAMALFYGDDGTLKPAAVRWLGQLAHANFLDQTTYRGDRDAALVHEGRRLAVLDIMRSLRLDTVKLQKLTRQLREIDDE